MNRPPAGFRSLSALLPNLLASSPFSTAAAEAPAVHFRQLSPPACANGRTTVYRAIDVPPSPTACANGAARFADLPLDVTSREYSPGLRTSQVHALFGRDR